MNLQMKCLGPKLIAKINGSSHKGIEGDKNEINKFHYNYEQLREFNRF